MKTDRAMMAGTPVVFPGTNTSVYPARSTGVAVFVGYWDIAQFWLFLGAPIIGGIFGAFTCLTWSPRIDHLDAGNITGFRMDCKPRANNSL